MLKNFSKSHPTLYLFLILFIIIVVLPSAIVLLRYGWGLIGFNITYSEGERVGQVVKLSEKGLIWKTYEATMGITQSGAYVDSWDISVDPNNPNKLQLISDLTRAYNGGELVKIRYLQKYGSLPWHGETSYFIQKVEFLER